MKKPPTLQAKVRNPRRYFNSAAHVVPKQKLIHTPPRARYKTRKDKGREREITALTLAVSREEMFWLSTMADLPLGAPIASRNVWRKLRKLAAVRGLGRYTSIRPGVAGTLCLNAHALEDLFRGYMAYVRQSGKTSVRTPPWEKG